MRAAAGRDFKVVIPARYAATRLPGKPLRQLAGRPLLQHVYERAIRCGAEVVIATDDERIAAAATGFGATVCMTASEHPSGTSRLAEVVDRYGWPDDTAVVNLQGDEPLVPPELLSAVAGDLASHPVADLATLGCRFVAGEALDNPNVVKLVTDAAGYALYFSRAPIPWDRDGFANRAASLPAGPAHLRHVGIYAYRAGFLRRYRELAASPLEALESLEQLRVLWHGGRIHVAVTEQPPDPGVDTEADLQRVEALLAAGRPG